VAAEEVISSFPQKIIRVLFVLTVSLTMAFGNSPPILLAFHRSYTSMLVYPLQFLGKKENVSPDTWPLGRKALFWMISLSHYDDSCKYANGEDYVWCTYFEIWEAASFAMHEIRLFSVAI
jgi:hypothetical protein